MPATVNGLPQCTTRTEQQRRQNMARAASKPPQASSTTRPRGPRRSRSICASYSAASITAGATAAYALVDAAASAPIVKTMTWVRSGRAGSSIWTSAACAISTRLCGLGSSTTSRSPMLSGNNWILGPLEGEQQPVVFAAAQLPAANGAPAPNDGEQQVIIDAVALSGEERSSGPSGSKPAIVVAAQLRTEDWTPEPTGGKQRAFVGAEKLSEASLEAVDSKHVASIVPENLPGDGTEPVASAEPEGVVAVMPVAAPSPSRKVGLATTFILISIGGFIVALSPPAPAVNTESPVVKPRSRRRRKVGPNTARTRRITSRRKGIRKSRQKASPKRRAKVAKKTPRKAAWRNRAVVR